MNKKRFSKILAVALAFVLCFAMAMPAFAAGTNYTPVAGSTTTFDKYLVMDEGANVPNVEFDYSIAPGQGATYNVSGKVFEVLEGIGAPTITWDSHGDENSTVKFTSTDNATLYAAKGETDYVKNLAAGQKYAKHTAIVSFAGINFPEPGVYRYIITEDTTATKPGITYDTDNTRVLDVYVIDENGTLKVQSYVLHANANSIGTGDDYGTDGNTIKDATTGVANGEAASDYKSQGFTNEYITHDLSFSKTVEGNQASRDKYFKFTVKIEGALPETTYSVDITGADAEPLENSATVYEDVENESSFTTDASGNKTLTFYLQHGQTITIKDLPEGATWTITETPEDYKPSAEVDTEDETFEGAAASVEGAEVKDTDGITADTSVDFTNTRDGVIPTGVLLTIAPFAVLLLVGIAGVAMIFLKKKRASAE